MSFKKLSWSGGLPLDTIALKAYSILTYGSPTGQAMTRTIPYVSALYRNDVPRLDVVD